MNLPVTSAGRIELPHPIAFVFGGGGSLGASQVGMLQALGEHRIDPDLIVGTSVGALNGAFLASDPIGASNRLSHIWPTIEKEQIFPGSAWRSIRTLQSTRTHLYENSALAAFIDEHLPASNIEDLAVPYVAIATDVDTGAPVPLDSGPLPSALLASTAIPGVFPAVERGDRLLYDGGLVANLALRHALTMGAASLVLLDCAFPGQVIPRPDSLFTVLDWSISLMMRRQVDADLPYIAKHLPVLYLPGPDRQALSPLEFDHTVELISGAYEASRQFLGTTHVDGPGMYRPPPEVPLPAAVELPAIEPPMPGALGSGED